jgi:AcrR family transcriptional regulator
MTPDERRAAIVATTLPLLVEHGTAVTTGQIATASGIAEGTVFRAFADKQELLWACVHAAFDPGRPVTALAEIPRELPVRERLLRASATVAEHWDRAMQVGQAVRIGCAGPPGGAEGPPGTAAPGGPADAMRALHAALADLLAPDADRLRLSPQRTAQLFLLAVASDRMLRMRMAALGAESPGDIEELIEVFLYGALGEELR